MLITPRVLDSPADTRPMLEDLRNQFRRLRTIRGVWPSSPEKQSGDVPASLPSIPIGDPMNPSEVPDGAPPTSPPQ
jgi:hypothetical protein